MKTSALLSVALLLSAAAAATAQAQLPDPGLFYRHPLTDIADPHEDVFVTYTFPEHPPPYQFPAGDTIDVLVGVHNAGDENVNVTAIMGSINSPSKFDIHVLNLTLVEYHQVVAPEQEVSLLYQFRPAEALVLREFITAINMYYHVDGEQYATTFFNTTADIVEQPKLIDTELIQLFIVLGAIMVGIAFLIINAVGGTKLITKIFSTLTSAKKKAAAKSSGYNKDEWLAGTTADPKRKAKKSS